MSKIAIVYGSSTGATESVAEKIKNAFDREIKVFDAAKLDVNELKPFDFLILGTSTTGIGELQEDWEVLLPKLEKLDFSGKKVALFGLGDSSSFSTSFASGMSVIYKALRGKVKIVGSVPTDGYNFDESDSVVDGLFVGLALDEDNEYDQTYARIEAWVEDLKKHLD